jgi:hypothetical protein
VGALLSFDFGKPVMRKPSPLPTLQTGSVLGSFLRKAMAAFLLSTNRMRATRRGMSRAKVIRLR